jgi:hypothetical protein
MSGNLQAVTKSGEQPFLMFHSFHENRLALSVKTRDPHQEPIGRVAFFRESKTARGDIPQNAICNLNIHLPDLDDLIKSSETDERERDVHEEHGEDRCNDETRNFHEFHSFEFHIVIRKKTYILLEEDSGFTLPSLSTTIIPCRKDIKLSRVDNNNFSYVTLN